VPRRRKKGNRRVAADATDVPLSRLLRVKEKEKKKREGTIDQQLISHGPVGQTSMRKTIKNVTSG